MRGFIICNIIQGRSWEGARGAAKCVEKLMLEKEKIIICARTILND
jgi:hypothetical protein